METRKQYAITHTACSCCNYETNYICHENCTDYERVKHPICTVTTGVYRYKSKHSSMFSDNDVSRTLGISVIGIFSMTCILWTRFWKVIIVPYDYCPLNLTITATQTHYCVPITYRETLSSPQSNIVTENVQNA